MLADLWSRFETAEHLAARLPDEAMATPSDRALSAYAWHEEPAARLLTRVMRRHAAAEPQRAPGSGLQLAAPSF